MCLLSDPLRSFKAVVTAGKNRHRRLARSRTGRMTDWLAKRWVVAAGFLAAAFIAVFPLISARYPVSAQLIYLCSPAYMIHQVEEHSHDRFRGFVNQRLFACSSAMTVSDVLIINLPLVWGVNLLSAYAACLVAPGYGLLAAYAMLINGLGHIVMAAMLRIYNPGLITAIALFVPLSGAIFATTIVQVFTSPQQHLYAFGAAVAFHLIIAGNAVRRAAAARSTQQQLTNTVN